MLPFSYDKPATVDRATAVIPGAASGRPTRAGTQFIAGGTNMTDYMKLGVARPVSNESVNCIGSRPSCVALIRRFASPGDKSGQRR